MSTFVVPKQQQQILGYLENNFEVLQEFLEKYKPEEKNMYFVTTKGTHCYSEIDYSGMEEVFILFGKETKGLPEDILKNIYKKQQEYQ